MQEDHLRPPAPEPRGVPSTVALAADLMFAGRIRGTAHSTGRQVLLARSPVEVTDAVRAGARRVLIDLDARSHDPIALIRALREDPTTNDAAIIAWASHVRADAIAQARAAGADRVLARSAFVRELSSLLAE